MRLLAIDIGSSSVKAAVLTGQTLPRRMARVAFPTIYDERHGPTRSEIRAEVRVAAIEAALIDALHQLGDLTRIDAIAPTTMAPSWLALDARGNALTNVVTHQDRRSTADAQAIEKEVGEQRHGDLAGNRPFPGGISSTTARWFFTHERARMKRARTLGHLGTWLTMQLTGERVIDLSNAGFTGLMDIRTLDWSDTLCEAARVKRTLLPRIVESDAIVGTVRPPAAKRFGLPEGAPVLAGCIDGSAAMLAASDPVRVGQLVNVCGSTDVLAVCTDRPHPCADLLTRPLGVDGKWLSVSTIAAAGSAIDWVAQTFYRDLDRAAFHRQLAKVLRGERCRLRFQPELAGSRTQMGIVKGGIIGLQLSTTREDILRALLDSLIWQSARRLDLFKKLELKLLPDVFVTGGGGALPGRGFRANWPKRFRDRIATEATMRGLWTLGQRI